MIATSSMATADIFLSYSHHDLERARELALALESHGWSVFWDRRIPPGRSFEDYIEQRLHECRAVVVMWSPQAVASKWVKIEAAFARERDMLIPVLIAPASLPFGYGHIHAADLTAWRHGIRALEFEELAASIEGLAPRQVSPTQTADVTAAPARPVVAVSPTGAPPRDVGATHSNAAPRFRSDAWYLPNESLLGLVEIPAGDFLMGSDKAKDPLAFDDERWSSTDALGRLTLSTFYLARYETTVAQFKAYVEATGTKPGDSKSVQGPDDHPVRFVSWREAIGYVQWLEDALKNSPETPAQVNQLLRHGWHVGLPSEAEWEKAARGADGRIYPWGNEVDPSRANCGGGATKPVGSYPTGASPYGLLDMSGNVCEWTRSAKKAYPYDARDGREDLKEQSARVVRGGSFNDGNVRDVRAASRSRSGPDYRYDDIGFRVVVSRFLTH